MNLIIKLERSWGVLDLKWADHKRITKDVSLVCGLPELLAKQIAEASVLPDKDPDYEIKAYVTGRRKRRIRTRKVRVKHHSQKAKEKAWNYLYQSRRALIEEDKNWIRYLGRALHYLQDYTVSKESEVFGIFPVNDWKKHNRLEASLSKVRFPLEPIKSLLKENIHANTLKNEVYMVKPSDNPADVLRLAVHLTALAIIGVVIPKEPENLDKI